MRTVRAASSPRERGCSLIVHNPASSMTVFPARAGLFPTPPARCAPPRGLPRASGAVPARAAPDRQRPESSPRERGCSRAGLVNLCGIRVFPARAGLFPARWASAPGQSGLPRASGAVPLWARLDCVEAESSPRERGCSHPHVAADDIDLVFPARAGLFPQGKRLPATPAGLPRASGAVPGDRLAQLECPRSSPRERGCSRLRALSGKTVLVFPARAGLFP